MELLKMMGERLKTLREEEHLTQKDMAELLNCTPSHYQKIEYGKVNISVSMLALLSDHFHVSTDYILGRAENQDINR
ncbi:XRE family transcriptional regulator [Pseudoflavonifractor sp. 60]|uniref:helix-turn-helix domain-containing protein n=1 Tax=Pseudoflavonifractor sp. 60 TaxID=2304576 RepID=UPI00136BE395|nr:helix-turn-helix transcriptional regulator [Pseudoflavonifractor sp. 60]NBI67850.1 XRE family transcriptional regulator [Pseudoflavonifractor sp. 60]